MNPAAPRRRWLPNARPATVIAWAGVGLAYLATRLIHLTLMPLFIDEGAYLWWGRQLLLHDFTRGWGQGKPLSGWLVALPLALGANPVLATRLGMVLVGAVGLAATVYLAATVLSPRAAFITAVAWVLLPYTFFFERLATPDVVLGCLVMLALAVCWPVLHADRPRPLTALAGGALLVFSALAKLPVSLFFFALPAGILLLSPAARRHAGWINIGWLYLIPVIFASGVVAIGGYRWSTGAHPIGFGFDDALLKSAAGGSRGTLIAANLQTLLDWAPGYLTWPVTVAIALAWLAAWFGPPLARLLAGAAALWLVIFVSLASFWVPRYVWPVLPALLVVLGWGLDAGWRRLAAWAAGQTTAVRAQWVTGLAAGAVLVALGLLVAPFHLALLTDPSRLRLPAIDRSAYVTDFGSGYGLPQAAAYLDQLAASEPASSQIIALTINDEARLRAYLAPALWPRLRQVQIVAGQNQDSAQQLARLKAWLAEASVTYVVVSSGQQWGPDMAQALPQAVLAREFAKPGGATGIPDYVLVFRVTPP